MEEDFYHWAVHLRSIKKSIAARIESAGGDPTRIKQNRKAIAQYIRRSTRAIPSAFHLSNSIVFYLLVLSFPCEYINPSVLVEILPKSLEKIIEYLRNYRCTIMEKQIDLNDYLFSLYDNITESKILYIYLNQTEVEFKKFLNDLKYELIRLIYNLISFGFKKEQLDIILLWTKKWIDGKILKEKELFDIIKLKIPKDISEYTIKPLIAHKSLRDQTSNPPIEEGKEKTIENKNAGKKKDIFIKLMKDLEKEKKNQLENCVEDFLDLLIKLTNQKEREEYFAANSDYQMFRKSQAATLVNFLIEKIENIKHCNIYIMLWDIIRLSVPEYTEDHKTNLIKKYEETFPKIDRFRYRYNLDEIKKCFHKSFEGWAIIDEADESVNLPDDQQKEGEGHYLTWKFEEFCKKIDYYLKEYKSNTKALEELDSTLHSIKIEGLEESEAIKRWAMMRVKKQDLLIDDWKRIRRLVTIMYQLKYATPKDFEEVKTFLFERIKDFPKVLFVKKSMLLVNGDSEDKLGSDCTLEVIQEFERENQALVKKSFRHINEVAKEIYDKKKPSAEQYEDLNKTLKRLHEALDKNHEFCNLKFRFKVYGSVAQTFWTKTSDIDISLVIENYLNRPPVF